MRYLTQDDNLSNLVKETHIVMLDFYADWCNPCKKLTNVLTSVQEEYKCNYKQTNDEHNDKQTNNKHDDKQTNNKHNDKQTNNKHNDKQTNNKHDDKQTDDKHDDKQTDDKHNDKHSDNKYSLEIIKIDVDTFADIAKLYKIRSLPTLIFYIDGELCEEYLTGYKTKEVILEFIKDINK